MQVVKVLPDDRQVHLGDSREGIHLSTTRNGYQFTSMNLDLGMLIAVHDAIREYCEHHEIDIDYTDREEIKRE